MLEQYLEIFYAIGTQLAGLIIPVIVLYIVVNLTANLLYQK